MQPTTVPVRTAIMNSPDADLPRGLWYRLAGLQGGRAVFLALSLTLLTACGSGSDGPTTSSAPDPQAPTPPTSPSPAPTPELHTVQGEVFAFETGMLGGAYVNLWVQEGASGHYYGPLRTDGGGLFQAPYVPDSHIKILASADGYVQPCAVKAVVRGDLAVRVEMVPVWSLASFNPVRPQGSTEPSLTGVIFETTASGRQPVYGAFLWVENEFEIGLATTESDRGGGFYLCNLGPAVWLHVSKDGYEARWVGPIDASESQVLEIELRRLP